MKYHKSEFKGEPSTSYKDEGPSPTRYLLVTGSSRSLLMNKRRGILNFK